jgi:hypothetical protein
LVLVPKPKCPACLQLIRLRDTSATRAFDCPSCHQRLKYARRSFAPGIAAGVIGFLVAAITRQKGWDIGIVSFAIYALIVIAWATLTRPPLQAEAPEQFHKHL